jgi:hypothetical protein
LAIDEPPGVTWIEKRVAAVTVSPVEPEMLPEVAVMVVDPRLTAVARPWVPTALEMVPTEVVEEVQVTAVVRFCTVLSL